MVKMVYKWAGHEFHGLKMLHPKSAQKNLNCSVYALLGSLLFDTFEDISIFQRWRFDEESQAQARLWMRHSYLAIKYGEEPPKIKIKYI